MFKRNYLLLCLAGCSQALAMENDLQMAQRLQDEENAYHYDVENDWDVPFYDEGAQHAGVNNNGQHMDLDDKLNQLDAENLSLKSTQHKGGQLHNKVQKIDDIILLVDTLLAPVKSTSCTKEQVLASEKEFSSVLDEFKQLIEADATQSC